MSERLTPSPGEPMVDPSQPSIQHVGDSVTTGTIPVVRDDPPGPRPGQPREPRRPVALWLGVLGVMTVLVGALAGVVWRYVVPLTVYRVSDDGGAMTTERGLADFVAGDAWFVVIGVVCGSLCGYLVWRWFAGLGWPMVVIAVAASLVMALTCWQVGWLLGPGPLERRVAEASAGAVLPIELTLRAHAALLAWPFFAMLPIMLLAALARDPEETRAR